jgi:hypothetical protein
VRWWIPSWKTAETRDLITWEFDKRLLESYKTKTRDEWVNKSIDFDVCLSQY